MVLVALIACNKDNGPEPQSEGNLTINFDHQYGGSQLEQDTFLYVNDAGNMMLFTEVQYFISDVEVIYDDGSRLTLDKWKDIWYADIDIPATLTWNVYDALPAGNVDSVRFIFGINEEKNQSFIFVNPPESLMFWPDILGGGYHYMKINGKWIKPDQEAEPFNFHLGIGQIYDNDGNIIGFVQNYFTVTLPAAGLEIKEAVRSSIKLVMNMESWFRTPNEWDFNYWGGAIMQNQAAMQAVMENGEDVFTLIVE